MRQSTDVHLLLSLDIEAGQAEREPGGITAAAHHRGLLGLQAPVHIVITSPTAP